MWINFLSFLLSLFTLKICLHIYQLKSYKFVRYLKFFPKNTVFYSLFAVFSLIFCGIFKIFVLFASLSILNFVFTFSYFFTLIKSKKTPLIFTQKAKRIYILSIIISAIFHLLPLANFIFSIVIFFITPIANLLNIYDLIKNKKYIKFAQQKIKNSGAKIVAITGSVGKTSVKNILFQLLNKKYNVLMSPKSFNTPLGISKFINENLTNDTQFLILEYGARKQGDISKLCKIFGADYGILTSIESQHLETFKTFENIIKEKNQLPLYLKNRLCIFNIDNISSQKLYDERNDLKCSISIKKFADIYATDITVNYSHTDFILNYNNNQYTISTSLLGKHSVTNILLALALCINFKIDINDLIESSKTIAPIEHRLQFVKNRLNIFDDSYNCSLASATEAVQVFKTAPNKKMIVTPGIIEGGNKQFDLNFELGKLIADFDFCVIVGTTNKYAIMSGILEQNKNANILCALSLDDSKKYISLLKQDDSILYLNDLPDDYK